MEVQGNSINSEPSSREVLIQTLTPTDEFIYGDPKLHWRCQKYTVHVDIFQQFRRDESNDRTTIR